MVTRLHSYSGAGVASVKDVKPIQVVRVETEQERRRWEELISRYHYLPSRRASMATLKYLVYGQNGILAALSFGGAGYKLKTRDALLHSYGLSRKEARLRLVVNSRFLILPHVRVRNLASAILGRVVRHVARDWQERFGVEPLLIETFVDPERFSGTSYRAANWLFWGYTQGSGRRGKGYVRHGKPKAIFLYPLRPRLRELMVSEQQTLVGKRMRLPKMSRLGVDAQQWRPHPLVTEEVDEDTTRLAELLVEFHREFSEAFGRKRQEQLGLSYLAGLLSHVKRKNMENIAEELVGPEHIRPLQRFVKNSPWRSEPIRAKLHEKVREELGQEDGMLSVDPSEFAKRGTESVGVKRQYCGRLGKVENCQSGVFVSYVGERGYALVDSRLYLPQTWFEEERRKRWQHWDIPEDTRFMTKPEIAVSLIGRIRQEGRLPFRWVGCDSFLGGNIELLEQLPEGVWFLARVSSTTRVWLERPSLQLSPYKGRGRKPSRPRAAEDPVEVKELLGRAELPWRVETVFIGSQGPLVARLLIIRVYLAHDKTGVKGPYWLIIRQSLDGEEVRFYLSNAPEGCSRAELKRALAWRWQVELCFRVAKSELGMADYETRSWLGWHRHMLYVQLALLFLLILKRRFKKNSAPESTPGEDADCFGHSPSLPGHSRSHLDHPPSNPAQPQGPTLT